MDREREGQGQGGRESHIGNLVAFDVVLLIITTSIRRPLSLVVFMGAEEDKERQRAGDSGEFVDD